MQGLSIAHAMPGTVAPASSPDEGSSGNAVAGGAAEEAGGSLFGAILAGQIKGKAAGADVSLFGGVAGKIKADGVSGKGKVDADLTPAALAELLAAAGIVPAPTVPSQQLGAAKLLQGGGDAALVATENSIIGTKKLAIANDSAAKMDRFALKVTKDAAENVDLLAAEDNMRAPGVEEFAGNGKLLSMLKQVADGVGVQGVMPDKSDRSSSKLEALGGLASDTMASSAAPLAMPLTQDASGLVPASRSAATEIAVPVGSPAWGDALADKVVWMSGQGHQVAELRLDPPHLGPLEVRLTMNNDQASAVFVSHHPAVREAIESAMPRLREMLADSGIMLGNTMVGAESFQQQQQAFAQSSDGRQGLRQDGSGVPDMAAMGGGGQSTAVTKMGRGLVDTFV